MNHVLFLTRQEAEQRALENSYELKSSFESWQAVTQQTDAQYSTLFPRLSFDAYYNYIGTIPQLETNGNDFLFGAHDNYAFGPTLSYTLWDAKSNLKAYHGLEKAAHARNLNLQDQKRQLLLSTRTNYVRVQQLTEELAAVNDSLNLARMQNQDIVKNLKAGGASKLDLLESERAVISYQIQYEEKQTELSNSLQDLLTRVYNRPVSDLPRPGIRGLPKVGLILDLDPIYKSLNDSKNLTFEEPDEHHPRVSSKEFLAQSSELQSDSIRATLWPTFKLTAKSTLQYPNGPMIEQINQNSILVTASFPLFEMSMTRHLAAQRDREASSTRFEKEQIRLTLSRDFSKAVETVGSLWEQRQLAIRDTQRAREVARLYYKNYQVGKSQLIDVDAANNRALLSRLNRTRIEAQLLNQIDLLRSLSSSEVAQ